MRHIFVRLVLACIRFYQKFLSFDTGLLRYVVIFPVSLAKRRYRFCRFTPSCSEYTYEAVSRYGIMNGLRLGLARILRCHPWSQGGYDPVL